MFWKLVKRRGLAFACYCPSWSSSNLSVPLTCAVRTRVVQTPLAETTLLQTSPLHSRPSFLRHLMYAAAASPYVAVAGAQGHADAEARKPHKISPSSKSTGDGNERRWRLYVIQSSQFAAKALLALDSQLIPYDCIHVNPVSRTTRLKQLPTDSFLVPQVEIPVGETGFKPVTDSTAILRAIDAYPHVAPGKLYPSSQIKRADSHISTVINAYVLYFNHVSPAGFERSIRAAILSFLPLGGLLGHVLPLRHLYSSTRTAMLERVVEDLGLGQGEELSDDKMLSALIVELERYEAALDGKARYLFGFGYPTAADCALHAMVSRFTDGMGEGALPAAAPQLWTVAGPRLQRLREWQDHMTEHYPYLWDRYKVDNVL